MLIEAPVFRGDKSLLHQRRHRFGRQLFASNRPDLVHHLAIGREDGEGAWAVEVVDATGVGQQAVKARHERCLAAGNAAANQGGKQPYSHQVGAAGLGSFAGGGGLAVHLS